MNSLNFEENYKCSEILTYKNYEKHILNCEFFISICPNEGCNQKFCKRDLEKH